MSTQELLKDLHRLRERGNQARTMAEQRRAKLAQSLQQTAEVKRRYWTGSVWRH